MSNRPGLRGALDAIATGQAAGLIVAKVDRLGRSTHDVSGIVERTQAEGWRVIAVDVGLDTATPSGELVATVLAMAARFEWHRTSERQVEKHNVLRRAGRQRGRPTVDASLADRLRQLHGRGWTYRRIAAHMTARAIPTARGGRWEPATVRSIIQTRERELAAQATA